MSLYCTPSDLLTTGVNPIAIQDLLLSQQNAACQQASDLADSYLRGRYQLPLLAWGTDLTYRTAIVAVYLLLQARGMNPSSGADERVRLNYEDSIRWFEGIQRQATHPNVTPSVPSVQSATYQLPQVFTEAQRGWTQFNSRGRPVIS